MDTATFVFELLLRNNTFMEKIDSFVSVIKKEKNIVCGIPQLVLNLTELLKTNILYNNLKQKTKITLNLDDMYALLELYRNYMFEKLICEKLICEKLICEKLICENDVVDCKHIYNICVKLAVLQLPLATEQKKWCL